MISGQSCSSYNKNKDVSYRSPPESRLTPSDRSHRPTVHRGDGAWARSSEIYPNTPRAPVREAPSTGLSSRGAGSAGVLSRQHFRLAPDSLYSVSCVSLARFACDNHAQQQTTTCDHTTHYGSGAQARARPRRIQDVPPWPPLRNRPRRSSPRLGAPARGASGRRRTC